MILFIRRTTLLLILSGNAAIGQTRPARTDIDQRLSLLLNECFSDIKEVAEEISVVFPPDKFHYLMVGRSPTPITAYLELKGLTNITTVPLSFHAFGSISSDENLYFRHFGNYLPPEEKLRGKTILLVDFTEQGESFLRSRILFVNYFKDRDIPVQSLALISPNAFAEHMLARFGNGILMHNNLGWALENLDFKDYSEYGTCAITTSCENALIPRQFPRSEYCKFKAELQRMMKVDRKPYIPGTIQIEKRKIRAS